MCYRYAALPHSTSRTKMMVSPYPPPDKTRVLDSPLEQWLSTRDVVDSRSPPGAMAISGDIPSLVEGSALASKR